MTNEPKPAPPTEPEKPGDYESPIHQPKPTAPEKPGAPTPGSTPGSEPKR